MASNENYITDVTIPGKLKDNLQQQLDEIETLASIFPKEFKLEEERSPDLIRNFLDGKIEELLPFISFIIIVNNETDCNHQQVYEMCVTLSHDYPQALPDIYIRNSALTRGQAAAINKSCSDHVATLSRGEPCIYSAVVWLQGTVRDCVTNSMELKPQNATVSSDTQLVRYWIYSHHIYNKTKRREILYLAGRLNITGFCMPGKPGIICVEGQETDCREWWASIRSMTWQKIMCKITEDAKTPRFTTFQEITFQANGSRNTHSNLGELYKYLEEHNLEFIFKELFGFEGGK